MEPAFGWTQLSQEDLRRVEDELAEAGMGVRDELGFLELHTLYADRFFPGTSVLLTRLRYCLFIPWIYRSIFGARPRKVRDAVQRSELELTRRLVLGVGSESGVIGRRSYPGLPSQPLTSIYWNTLGRWGVVRPMFPGTLDFPTRGEVERFVAQHHETTRLTDDDKLSVAPPAHRVFAEVPAEPGTWSDSDEPITFDLTDDERAYMRAVLAGVRRPDGEPSLLARLAAQTVVDEDLSMWSTRVYAVADELDSAALDRAGHVAEIAMIGRALYAAMVEELRDQFDGAPTEQVHRVDLGKLIQAVDVDELLRFDPDDVRLDANASDDSIRLLKLVQDFLRAPTDVLSLHNDFANIELSRKGWRRARLHQTPAGRERRLEWTPADHPHALPLHYRWFVAERLLQDLEGV